MSGMTDIHEKPTCLLCGKALRKTTYGCEVPVVEQAPPEIYGKKVVQVIRRKKLTWKPGFDSLSLWCGEWGGYGDNFFCGLNCGYRWAVMLVKTNEKQQPRYVAQFRERMKKFSEAAR